MLTPSLTRASLSCSLLAIVEMSICSFDISPSILKESFEESAWTILRVFSSDSGNSFESTFVSSCFVIYMLELIDKYNHLEYYIV